MPEISRFYGIIIRLFFDEHNPPHFHAQYGGHSATYSIKEPERLTGKLPRRAEFLVLDWAETHQKELMEDWELCMKNQQPFKIEPLE